METKLKRVRRLDSIKLDANDKTYFTKEGYLVDHPILTSVGIFEYTNPDGSIRRELRLPEHVFNEKSLETYKGKPIIITHEAGVVDKGNVDKEQIGTILTKGYQDEDDVRAEIIIHDTDSMKDCGLKELSLGYNLDLVEEPGEYNGEPYDAIQTNIAINHLALVSSARAGEQARLNIDGSDEPELKGGKAMAKVKSGVRLDDGPMSAEELAKAVEAYKARKAERNTSAEEVIEDGDGDTEPIEEEVLDEGNDTSKETGSTPEEIAQMVKDRRDRRDSEDDPADVQGAMGVIAQQDEDIDMLLACIENLLANKDEDDTNNESVVDGEGEEEKEDSSDDEANSINADSANKIFRQRLSICRIGDKLRMDGLETKSILDGKKEIVKKVLPTMNLDGKSKAYIDAAYDMAVAEVNKRKDCNYQRSQMNNKNLQRKDSKAVSMANSARERMIERQGGNQ